MGNDGHLDPGEWKESFASRHIRSAALFAREAGRIEKSVQGDENSFSTEDEIDILIQYQLYATNSVISSFSFLESRVNELYDWILWNSESAIKNNFSSQEGFHPPGVLPNDKRLYEIVYNWDRIGNNSFTNMPTLKKYQTLLSFSGCELFDPGKQPYQDVKTIGEIRNYFIHYEPETYRAYSDDEHIDHRIGSALQGKFDLNPFSADSDPYFPHQCMSYGCAKWAFSESKSFVDEFSERLGIVPTPTPATKSYDLEV